MADMFSSSQRSENMRRIRSTDTGPEKAVAKALKKAGLRYVRYSQELPGKPDFIIRDAGRAIFVHGCFWHQHDNCSRKFMPKSRRSYWRNKLQGNVRRFKDVSRELKEKGWRVSVVWECQTKEADPLIRKVSRYGAKKRDPV